MWGICKIQPPHFPGLFIGERVKTRMVRPSLFYARAHHPASCTGDCRGDGLRMLEAGLKQFKLMCWEERAAEQRAAVGRISRGGDGVGVGREGGMAGPGLF